MAKSRSNRSSTTDDIAESGGPTYEEPQGDSVEEQPVQEEQPAEEVVQEEPKEPQLFDVTEDQFGNEVVNVPQEVLEDMNAAPFSFDPGMQRALMGESQSWTSDPLVTEQTMMPVTEEALAEEAQTEPTEG